MGRRRCCEKFLFIRLKKKALFIEIIRKKNIYAFLFHLMHPDGWGDEERGGGFPFKKGEAFKMVICVDKESFFVNIIFYI